jgi:hypothetical protein
MCEDSVSKTVPHQCLVLIDFAFKGVPIKISDHGLDGKLQGKKRRCKLDEKRIRWRWLSEEMPDFRRKALPVSDKHSRKAMSYHDRRS